MLEKKLEELIALVRADESLRTNGAEPDPTDPDSQRHAAIT